VIQRQARVSNESRRHLEAESRAKSSLLCYAEASDGSTKGQGISKEKRMPTGKFNSQN